ncbi:MAG: helix-turn-helix transcriptional regulator [Imperialibacter sp.]
MSELFDKALGRVPEDVKRFVDHSFDVVNQIHDILEKQGKTQRDLAGLLGKSESEISKWMRGTHNFTLQSIAKIEAALGESIIMTASKASKSYSKVEMVPVEVFANSNRPTKGGEFVANIGWDKVRNGEVFRDGLKYA